LFWLTFGKGVDNFLAGVVSGTGMPLLENDPARHMIILPLSIIIAISSTVSKSFLQMIRIVLWIRFGDAHFFSLSPGKTHLD